VKGRVTFNPPGIIGFSFDWDRLVDKPFKEDNINEAFSNADAMIDSSIHGLLRFIYEEDAAQDLLNELIYLRGRVNLDSLIFLEVLKQKKVVDDEFVNKVRQFKKARNLVLHSMDGEYALVIGHPDLKYTSQEELDSLALEISKKWIVEAYEIFLKLFELSSIIDRQKKEDPNYYFSIDFYYKYPHIEFIKKKFPHLHKTKKIKTK